MSNQMPQTKEARDFHAFWLKLDNVLREKKGIYSGVPLGLLHDEDITTDDPTLLELMDEIGIAHPLDDDAENDEIAEAPDGSRWTMYKTWEVSRPWRGSYGTVGVLKNVDTGMYRAGFTPSDPVFAKFSMWFKTCANSGCFNLAAAEQTAQKRLFKALSEHQRTMYTLTGSFVEKGASGVHYLLRKCRPTLAFRVFDDGSPDSDASINLLCALCLHPLAYYTGTWAGALPPSDEVLSHLLFIRADEHYFWRKANQIPPEEPRSGL